MRQWVVDGSQRTVNQGKFGSSQDDLSSGFHFHQVSRTWDSRIRDLAGEQGLGLIDGAAKENQGIGPWCDGLVRHGQDEGRVSLSLARRLGSTVPP